MFCLHTHGTITVGNVAMPAEQTCENAVAALDAVVGRWVTDKLSGVKMCVIRVLLDARHLSHNTHMYNTCATHFCTIPHIFACISSFVYLNVF